MNLREGTRRLGLLLGAVGAILGGFASYLILQPALEQRARHNRFEQLANSDVVKQERPTLQAAPAKPAAQDDFADIAKPAKSAPSPEKDKWSQYEVKPTAVPAHSPTAKYEIVDPDDWKVTASEVDKSGIKLIHWTKNYAVESIETEDGQTLYPTPIPSAWTYPLVALFPILGFFIPWGAVRAIGWAGAGFLRGYELVNGDESVPIPPDESLLIPPELQAKLEEGIKAALKQHTDELRRTFQISTGFYEKLVALDAGSIAIAASVGAAIMNKAAVTPSPALRSISHWLVWIILSLWVSLISGLVHNFVIVGIAQLEASYSKLDFLRKLMRDILNVTTSLVPGIDQATIDNILKGAEAQPHASQRMNVILTDFLKEVSPTLGYLSMLAFIGAYTLVAICTWWLWL